MAKEILYAAGVALGLLNAYGIYFLVKSYYEAKPVFENTISKLEATSEALKETSRCLKKSRACLQEVGNFFREAAAANREDIKKINEAFPVIREDRIFLEDLLSKYKSAQRP